MVACGGIYRIQAGDTLFGLATRRVQPPVTVQAIIRHNPGKIENAGQVPAGMDLQIPCANETTTKKASAPVDTTPTATVEAPKVEKVAEVATIHVDILTGSTSAPFAERMTPKTDITTELVNRVMTRSDSGIEHSIDVIDDWSAHLHVLLERGKYDLAYPWTKPDCGQADKLDEDARWRCDNLRFSAPLGEVKVKYYARTDEAAMLAEPIRLWGKRLCRPYRHFTHDLAARDLVPPHVNHVRAASAAGCFRRLLDGEVDVVSIDADTASMTIADLRADGAVAEIKALATIETLHVVGMRDNDSVEPMLRDFDRGLAELLESGIWETMAQTSAE